MTTEQNPTPDPTPTPPPAPKEKAPAGDSPRYAVYDNTYLRFVGGTHENRKAATAAAKAAGLDDYEIREV